MVRSRAVRSYVGWRYWLAAIGIALGTAGLSFGISYDLVHKPSFNEQNADSNLEHVVYRVPEWPWQLAQALVAVGAVLFLIAFLTAPKWREGTPLLPDGGAAGIVPYVLLGVALFLPAGIVLVISRGASPRAADVLLILAIVAAVAVIGLGLWLLQEWRSRRTTVEGRQPSAMGRP